VMAASDIQLAHAKEASCRSVSSWIGGLRLTVLVSTPSRVRLLHGDVE
jgi:hypothetical protein